MISSFKIIGFGKGDDFIGDLDKNGKIPHSLKTCLQRGRW